MPFVWTPSLHSCKRRLLLVCLIFPGIVSLSTCGRHETPEAVYQHARRTFIHGDLKGSRAEAQAGYRRFASDSQWAWKFQTLEAESLLWQGIYPEVLKLLESSLNETTPPDAAVAILTLRGVAHGRQNDLVAGGRELEDAKKLCLQIGRGCGQVYQGLGVFALGQNQFSETRASFEQALSVAKETGDRFLESNSLLNIAGALVKEGRFDEAIDHLGPASEAAAGIGAEDLMLAARENLGWAYYRLGDSERAWELLIAAEKRAEQFHDDYARENALTDIGYIQFDQRHLDEAEHSFQQALSLATAAHSKEHMYNVLRVLARLAVENNNLDKADHYASQALDISRENNSPLDELYPVLVQGQIAARRGNFAGAEQKFRRVLGYPEAPLFLAWEAHHSLARTYEDQRQWNSADREYRASIAVLETGREAVTKPDFRLSFLSNGSRIYDDYVHFLVSVGKTEEALRWADYSRARTLAEGLNLLPKEGLHIAPHLNATKLAAEAKGTLLFYWLGEKSSYLWLITTNQVRLFSIPSAKEIESLVDRYNKALTGPEDVLESANTDGRTLFEMLVMPANRWLKSQAKVFIVPDGKLNRLNFETLLVSKPELHYWIEDVTVINAGSLRMIGPPHRETRPGNRSVLLLGGVVSPSPEFPELTNSVVEMRNVSKHFPAKQQKVLQGPEATATAYLQSKPEQFSHIHFVAHAVASGSIPLDSAIILSRPGPGSDHFKLYARDIIQHPLRADLVTISSCFSAGTRAYSGEGLVGLSWAFLRAGAHNVIAALWEASDLSSAKLMNDFYENLSTGMPPESALHLAKLSLLRSGSAFRKPLYWAPFQLYTVRKNPNASDTFTAK